MTKLKDILGAEDSDYTEFAAAVGNLAYSNFTDAQIAAFAVEEAQAYRRELSDALENTLKPKEK